MPLFINPMPGRFLGTLRAVALLLATLPVSVLAADAFSLTVSPQESTDGVAKLSWNLPDTKVVVIQRSDNPAFQRAVTLYQGEDTGTTITGLADGNYYFRAGSGAMDSGEISWGNSVHLRVEHHPLSRAFLFFGIGVVVFLATLALIIGGSRRAKGDV